MRNAAQERAVYTWWTVARTAQELGVSAATVRNLLPELEAIDVSPANSKKPIYRVAPASVERFVQRRRVWAA